MLESDNRSLKFLKFIDYAKSKETIRKISTPSSWKEKEVEILAKTIRDHKNATDILLVCRDVIHANIFLSIAEGNIESLVVINDEWIGLRKKRADIKETANLLKMNKTLQNLCLSNNAIDEKNAEYITEVLKINKDLKYLDLSNNYLKKGLNSIFEALMVNESLEELVLQDDFISTESLILLQKRKNKNLKITNMYLEAWYGNSEDN